MPAEERRPEPGEPTEVAGGQVGLLEGLARGAARLGGEFLLEAVGSLMLCALTTTSLAAVFFGTQWAYDRHPGTTWAVGATVTAVLLYGGWLGLRPGKPRNVLGRVAAGSAGAVGVWVLACLGYAEFGGLLS